MLYTISIENGVFEQWEAYHAENQAWSLDELVTRLLAQHFQEANTVKASVEAQERTKKGN